MGRKPFVEVPNGTFHVYARGNSHQSLFIDDADRERYLRILADAVADFRWRCLAYCLMGNHVHLVLETPQANLSRGMCAAHFAYARSFNLRHGRVNHLFGERFGRAELRDPQHVRRIALYVARNPVEAGLCSRPEAWPWNSYGIVKDGGAPPWLDVDALAGHFGGLRRYLDLAGDVGHSGSDGARGDHVLPDLRAAVRDGGDGGGGAADEAAA